MRKQEIKSGWVRTAAMTRLDPSDICRGSVGRADLSVTSDSQIGIRPVQPPHHWMSFRHVAV